MCIYECPLRVFKECQNLPKRLDLIGFSLDRDLSDKEFATVDAKNLWTLLNEGKYEELPELIDVREPREFQQRPYIWCAVNSTTSNCLSRSRIAKRWPYCPYLPQQQAQPASCRHYGRSRLYEVSILEGGMLAWESAGLLEAVDTFTNPDQTKIRSG